MIYATIEQGVKELQKGNVLIVIDDENRENEGDLVIAAEKATPTKINWLLKYGRGILCVALEGKRLDKLSIPLMVSDSSNTENTKCSFTVSVDLKKETTTGVSAQDRTKTIKALVDDSKKSDDFARPGHVFPLRARSDGVLEREGHTEAVVDLCKIGGLYPAGVIIEKMNEDGTMAKKENLERFAEEHKLMILKINDLVEYRKKNSV